MSFGPLTLNSHNAFNHMEVPAKPANTSISAAAIVTTDLVQRSQYVPKTSSEPARIVTAAGKTFSVVEFLDSGSTKEISLMTGNQGEKAIRAVVRVRGNVTIRDYKGTLYEVRFIEKLYAELTAEEKKYFIPPYEECCETTTKHGEMKLVLKGEKFDGNGMDIPNAQTRQIVKFFQDSATALSILHDFNHVYMDFKPQNALIAGDPNQEEPIQAKLNDFGGVKQTGEKITVRSPLYQPPEYFQGNVSASPKNDSYSLGVAILCKLFGKDKLYSACGGRDKAPGKVDINAFFIALTKDIDVFGPDYFVRCSLINLARQLMQENPESRLSCAEAAERLAALLQKL